MARKHSTKKGFCLGAVIGGLVAGTTALLFAPKSGDKMRKSLSKHYHKSKKGTQRLLEEVCSEGSDLAERAKGLAKHAKSAATRISKSSKKR